MNSLPYDDAALRPQRATEATTNSRSLMPVADNDVIGSGPSLPGLHQVLEAHQEDCPLGAAVGGELHLFLPSAVGEVDHRVVARLGE